MNKAHFVNPNYLRIIKKIDNKTVFYDSIIINDEDYVIIKKNLHMIFMSPEAAKNAFEEYIVPTKETMRRFKQKVIYAAFKKGEIAIVRGE